jgi:hypothetical protein
MTQICKLKKQSGAGSGGKALKASACVDDRWRRRLPLRQNLRRETDVVNVNINYNNIE